MHGDVVRQLDAAAGDLDEHGVDAAATLDVVVAVEHVAVGRLDAHDLAELDLLLERDLQLLELGRPLGDGVGALGGDEVDQRLGFGLELLAAGDEVGLALELRRSRRRCRRP